MEYANRKIHQKRIFNLNVSSLGKFRIVLRVNAILHIHSELFQVWTGLPAQGVFTDVSPTRLPSQWF